VTICIYCGSAISDQTRPCSGCGARRGRPPHPTDLFPQLHNFDIRDRTERQACFLQERTVPCDIRLIDLLNMQENYGDGADNIMDAAWIISPTGIIPILLLERPGQYSGVMTRYPGAAAEAWYLFGIPVFWSVLSPPLGQTGDIALINPASFWPCVVLKQCESVSTAYYRSADARGTKGGRGEQHLVYDQRPGPIWYSAPSNLYARHRASPVPWPTC
jgi:hypothetical protein